MYDPNSVNNKHKHKLLKSIIHISHCYFIVVKNQMIFILPFY